VRSAESPPSSGLASKAREREPVAYAAASGQVVGVEDSRAWLVAAPDSNNVSIGSQYRAPMGGTDT